MYSVYKLIYNIQCHQYIQKNLANPAVIDAAIMAVHHKFMVNFWQSKKLSRPGYPVAIWVNTVSWINCRISKFCLIISKLYSLS